jgi:hypothetical protein
VGALTGGVVGDAGFLGEGRHLHAPALLHLVVEVAHIEVGLLVGDDVAAQGGDVCLPLEALGFGDAVGMGGVVERVCTG